MGCGAHTVARRVSDDLLRYPATIPQQPAIQSPAMGAVQFARRLAQYAIDASDWRLWTWWLWTRWLRIRAGSLWPTIRPIWRAPPPPGPLVKTPEGPATPNGAACTRRSFSTKNGRGGPANCAPPPPQPRPGQE